MNIYDILSFDHLYGVISWDERVHLHRCRLGKEELNITPRIQAVMEHIEIYEYERPTMKFGQDKLLYCEVGAEWQLVEDYIKENMTYEIRKLQSKNQ